MQQAGLYIVATPIGNLEDISHRATRILGEVDLVVAEDTRHSRVLLEHYGIQRPLQSLHEHNEQERIPALLAQLEGGATIALVSDAGTPLISDPGFRLVRQAAARGVRVVPIPGPSAVTAALSSAGLPTDRFVFEGFLPPRSGMRRRCLESMRLESRTMVFFESGRRIQASLADLADIFTGAREAVICRELTKQFESILRGSLEQLRSLVDADANQRRGEFTVLVAGCAEREGAIDGLELARQLMEFLPASQAARVAARVTGGDRRSIYDGLQPETG